MGKKKTATPAPTPAPQHRIEPAALAEHLSANRGKILLLSSAGAVVVLAVFLPALRNGFVNWDDNSFVYQNPNIRTMGREFWKWALQYHVGNWCPLTWVSHALDYALWGLNPSGHHFTSILLHALNTLLFMLLIVELLKSGLTAESRKRVDTPRRYLAFSLVTAISGGLFFGLSPLRVESVVWIAERRDVLFLFFGLLSLLCYLRRAGVGNQKSGKIYYVMSIICFCAGLMCKSMLVTLPLVLLLIDFYPLGRFSSRKGFAAARAAVIEKAPFFVIAAGSAVLTYLAQEAATAVMSLSRMPLQVRFWISIRACLFYVIKTIAPTGLSCLYLAENPILIDSLPYFGALVVLLLIAVTCLLLVRRDPLYVVVLGYYLVTLAPVMGVVQVGNQFAADRYTYFPTLSLALLFGLAVGGAYRKFVPVERVMTRSALLALAIPVVILGAQITMLQNQIYVWQNSINLWSRAIELYPGIIATPYKNRGAAYFEGGNAHSAIEDWNTAISLEPSDPTVYVNRAAALLSLGNAQGALEDFVRAARMGNPTAQNFLLSKGIQWR
jgi:hypothetical protein